MKTFTDHNYDSLHASLAEEINAALEVERDAPPYGQARRYASDGPAIVSLRAVTLEVLLVECEALPITISGSRVDGLHTLDWRAELTQCTLGSDGVQAVYEVEEG